MPVIRKARGAVVVAVAVAVGLSGQAVPIAAEDAEPSTQSAYVGAVTLVTGDRVTVRRVGPKLIPAVDPAPGREHVQFAATGDGDRLHVVPADAWGELNAGTLDLRLFDVAGLIRDGDGDERTTELALINADLSAVRVPKADLARTWAQRRESRAPARLWLDGLRRPSLDTSVPQIGAPQAWRAGFTGDGVTVAVLDTGADGTHPDLNGRIAASRNFTDDKDDRDTDGHGTHVASTIAGTGAASGGKQTGVAPGARLIVGKVCGARGCPESAILAGMRWAVESGAKIVNLSLGGPDTAGDDPLETAVDQLSRDRGALFVVAAGNDGGYGAETVASPASADRALAVGSVDGGDALSGFSARGPRVRDGALKPDILAPGEGIMAARSKHSSGSGRYRELQGTSMATPHVAGSAAILAQRHPDWPGARLKAALMGSAEPIADAGPFEQGAGRVDVARGVGQGVVAEPASVSMGRQAWPHDDDPVLTRTLTYANTTDQPVELAVRVDGSPMIRVSAERVAVPARGQASVEVVAATAGAGEEGPVGARVVAEGGSTRVVTPVAVDREPESYDLTIKTVDAHGALTDRNFSFLFGVDPTRYRPITTADGVGVVRVRKGRYHLDSVVATPRPDGVTVDTHKVVHPTVDVTADTTVVLAAKDAGPISVAFDRPGVRPKAVGAGYGRVNADRAVYTGILGDTFERIFLGQVGDPVSDAEFVSDVGGAWTVPDGDDVTTAAVAYHLAWFDYGRVPTGFARRIADRDLAEVRTTYREQADRRGGTKLWVAREPRYRTALGYGLPLQLPRVRTEYHNVDDLAWSAEFQQWRMSRSGPTAETVVTGGVVAHEAGKSYVDEWNSAAFGPGFGVGEWATRGRESMSLAIPLFADAGLDRSGTSATGAGSTVLYRDGVRIGETDAAGVGGFDVPAEPGRYRLEASATRDGVSRFSTALACVWEFTSQAPPETRGKGGVPLPLIVVRLAPAGLDASNTVAADSTTVAVTVQWNNGVEPNPVTALSLSVSTDDGKTWAPAQITDGVARVDHPRSAKFVSLRAKAADAAGNTVEQTTIRAYGV